MSTIRKQSILSSIVVYLGFVLGFVNTYLFTREGGFTAEEYGLTSTFIAFATVMASFATLGMPAFIAKFFPYYNDRLALRNNDILTLALGIGTLGYAVVVIAGILFKNQVLQRFDNAPLLQEYYFWIFPFGFGFALFSILEIYGWNKKIPITTNFLKEFAFRLIITVLVLLSTIGLLFGFRTFVHLYAFSYPAIALGFLAYLLLSKKAAIVPRLSIVTQKFRGKIITLSAFVWSGGLIFNLASVFDTIVLTAVLPNGLAVAGVFALAQNITSLIQAPQRAVVSASMGPLSKAWKDKDYDRINRIYARSSINLLLFSTAMFCLIWLNFDDGVYTFNLQKTYLQAKVVFLFIGITRIIDLGTGVNSQIIGTSTFWRFDFFSGMILLSLALPLNFFLTRELGLIGPAISNLVSFTVYNAVRYVFLYRKFGMQPFTAHTAYTLLLGAASFLGAYLLFNQYQGLVWMAARSVVFLSIFGTGTLLLKLSPDIEPVWQTVRKRIGFR